MNVTYPDFGTSDPPTKLNTGPGPPNSSFQVTFSVYVLALVSKLSPWNQDVTICLFVFVGEIRITPTRNVNITHVS